MKEPRTALEAFDASLNHTGSRIEADMNKNTGALVELRSQLHELREYLIGTHGLNGTSLSGSEPEGFFGRIAKANYEQRDLIGEASDIVLELRNYF